MSWRAQLQVAALPSQSPLIVKEDEVVLDFLRGDPLGAAAVMMREPGDGVEIGLLGVLGEAANGHVAGHALSKRGHGLSPSGSDLSRRHAHARARRRGGRRPSIKEGRQGSHPAP